MRVMFACNMIRLFCVFFFFVGEELVDDLLFLSVVTTCSLIRITGTVSWLWGIRVSGWVRLSGWGSVRIAAVRVSGSQTGDIEVSGIRQLCSVLTAVETQMPRLDAIKTRTCIDSRFTTIGWGSTIGLLCSVTSRSQASSAAIGVTRVGIAGWVRGFTGISIS